jgi:protein TonB
MPRFPGCEDKGPEEEKKSCAQAELLKFVYKNLQYPAVAKANGIEGIVVVTFVVEPDGTVSDAKVVRDIGAGCGDEAVRIVNLMNELGIKWTHQRSRGRLVPVQFNLPVKFKL